jgi:anthranilate phosphoribosyltransferase
VPRRELGVRTVFNLLGPLTNPARPRYQLLGVGSEAILDLMAESLLKLGVERALVVHSADGLDEISISGPTMVREVSGGEVRAYEIAPEDFGIEPGPREAILGGDAETNAAILRAILEGTRDPTRDAAVINAAAALYASGRAGTLASGAEMAQRAIDSGAAHDALQRLRTVSRGARAGAGGRA